VRGQPDAFEDDESISRPQMCKGGVCFRRHCPLADCPAMPAYSNRTPPLTGSIRTAAGWGQAGEGEGQSALI